MHGVSELVTATAATATATVAAATTTTATAAVATAAAAAAATAAVAATTATAAAATLTGLGFVDRQATAVNFLVMHRVDRPLGGIVFLNLDETESPAAPRLAILDNLSTGDRAKVREHLLESVVGHAPSQVSNVKLLTHLNPSPTSDPRLLSGSRRK